MARLGVGDGRQAADLLRPSGIGDLITTTTFPTGRNLSVGRALGEGKKLDEILGGMNSVVEGVWTTKAALALARKHKVEMPITKNCIRSFMKGNPPKKRSKT
jgi:glycerol-3-phosphate dehydrogenase (NAD(P)+)